MGWKQNDGSYTDMGYTGPEPSSMTTDELLAKIGPHRIGCVCEWCNVFHARTNG